MKCREKLAIEHPKCIDPSKLGGCLSCPDSFDYMDKPDWCDESAANCTKCWDREIPGTKPTKKYEHDCCVDCKNFTGEETDEPCVRCKGTAIPSSVEYETRPDLFEPEEILVEKVEKVEMVDHPSHYNQGSMEVIDEMELIFGAEAVMDFCLLNAWKYRARAAYKGKPEEDMEKANWYINKYKELMERDYGK